MTMASPARPRSVMELVGDVVEKRVAELQRGYLDDQSAAVAALAQLRRGAGKLPQDMPELWGVTGVELLFQDQALPDREASRAEAALFLAVTLYALHQQSRSDQRMHKAGIELGEAVRRLMSGGDIDEPIRRRFVRVGAATTPEVLAYRLREIVSLLRREAIPLDYARLARRLYQAQVPGGMQQVRQIWGRSFHAYRPQTSTTGTAGNGATNDKDA
ncbi:CRISPR system Cascade subunit CasB [Thermomonospora echinospora]|uniref:CRISPR system Cascade subunit CasB n=1 Tax=Thermomonospora echinospora TaxID=1992 RepID=A0A1H6E9W9_9ACTN|nr:type I-E CRISPR-associated protein Cse2/CasB [Thermomonospora echinospora]SEG93899.1 CRISPR system Cascade subunit CasB [Thermomonospora echinospora]